ncbi:hypothetical protein GCM10010123_20960 [Pilimelia anulata]|uniref:Uncharacterized protein n=1 Tax=Pilimelia anulata TaxID=53371 RepID=A0A8J3B650_9ACTN|nr:hypothetical protein [Pilimelia anulata]GGJ90918.1 hypothetical protein GCM10010123_20960 [Pilimelia anulata]
MDNKFARTSRSVDVAADSRTPDILDALLNPVGAHRLPDSLPGVAAPRPYVGAARAVAKTPTSPPDPQHPEVAMSETTTTTRRPLAISARSTADETGTAAPDTDAADGAAAGRAEETAAGGAEEAAEALLKPVPLAPLSAPAPARGRARVPRMREPEGMRVDLLGVWHAKDRQSPLPAVIWEEMTAAHPELFDAADPDRDTK